MILFFPQYQAGYMPSRIPQGTESLRGLWQGAPDFREVPVEETAVQDDAPERGIKFRAVLKRQLAAAMDILKGADPDFILTTGGDCGASFAAIAHINEKYEGRIGVLWIDAHGDIHTPETSPSGHYHGMVLRHLLGDVAFDIQPPRPLRPHQIGYLGLRDTEIQEDEVISRLGIPKFSAAEVMAADLPLGAVLNHFQKNGITHLYLHVDCDVMDEAVFPHVHVPEPDGMTLDRLIAVLQQLRAAMPIAGCCLTEYAPQSAGEGMDVLKRIYKEGFGLILP